MKFEFTDAIIIALTTVLSYAIYFLYEIGYCSYFNTPTMFIEISLTRIVATMASLFLLLSIVYIGLTGIFNLIPVHIDEKLYRVFSKHLLYIIILVIPWTVFDIESIVMYFLLAVIVLIMLQDFIFPLITQRKVKGYLNKIVVAQRKAEETVRERDERAKKHNKNYFNNWFMERMPFVSNSAFVFFMISVAVMNFGEYSAENQKSFTLLEKYGNNKKYVVFGEKNEHFVVRELDLLTNTISNKLSFVESSEASEIWQERIGRIKVEDDNVR